MNTKKGILFTADLHLRDTVPTCRTDDFENAQWRKLQEIIEIVRKEKLYWVDCGDIFHKAQPSFRLVNRFIDYMKMAKVQIDAAICGNHDLPSHNFGQLDNSAFGTLLASKIINKWLHGPCVELPTDYKIFTLYGVNWTEMPYSPDCAINVLGYRNIMVMHNMFFPNKHDTIPNVDGFYADEFIDTWGDEYQYIFTGHNHKSFSISTDKCELHNIGCVTRQTADMAGHRPCVCILCNNGVQIRYLHANVDAVSQAHIDKQQAQENQISSFVKSLENIEDTSLSFERNVQTVINKVKPENEVRQKVQGAME